MRFSAFARFGHLRFCSKPPVGQTIYGSLRESLGGEENLGEDAFTGPACAELFATAMALANVQRTVDRVNRERIPHTSEEFIERHEYAYRITTKAGETMAERREALAIAELLSRGCSATVLQEALDDLLGAELIQVRVADETEYVVSPANWDTTGAAVWKRADVVAKWRLLTAAVEPGLYSLTTSDLSGAGQFVGGEVAIIEPGVEGIQEKVTIVDSGGILATFVRHHDAGSVITTEPWPWAQTTSREILVVVTSTVARSTAWRKKIHSLLSKMLRCVDTYDVVEEYSAGVLGPFYPGEGIPGITIVGTIPTVP